MSIHLSLSGSRSPRPSPRPSPSSGYCSSDDELNYFLFSTISSSSGHVGSTSGQTTSRQYSDGSCPVTPDSVTSEVKLASDLELFDNDLQLDLNAGLIGCPFGSDLNWLRPPLLDDLGLELDPVCDGVKVHTRTVASEQSSSRTGHSPGGAFAGSVGDERRLLLPVSSQRLSDTGCHGKPIRPELRLDSEVVSLQLPANIGCHGNDAERSLDSECRRVAMTTSVASTTVAMASVAVASVAMTTAGGAASSSGIRVKTSSSSSGKRRIGHRDLLTSAPEPRICYIMSDHRYSSCASQLPGGPPPSKVLRLEQEDTPVVSRPPHKASILATLLLTKEPLSANAGSDAVLALTGSSPEGPHHHPGGRTSRLYPSCHSGKSVLEGLLTESHHHRKKSSSGGGGGGGGSGGVDGVVQTTSSRWKWKASYSMSGSLESYELSSDCLLKDSNGLHLGLTSVDEGTDIVTSAASSPQVSSLEPEEDFFAQQVSPDDLWMHLSDLL